MNKGFTLIELLVVVLIIGILVAIALPQYQKAVERSRMAEATQVLGDWATAQSVYYMQHGEFAENFDELNEGDINIVDPSQEGKWIFDFNGGGNVMATAAAHRDGGRYAGSNILSVWVFADGRIAKHCEFNLGDETAGEFCNMAAPMGYIRTPNPEIRPPGGGLGPFHPGL